jgi:membrane protease YdiL (CAAX protease family)
MRSRYFVGKRLFSSIFDYKLSEVLPCQDGNYPKTHLIMRKKVGAYPVSARIGLFILLLLCLWLPFAAPLAFYLSSDPDLLSILAMGLLFLQFFWFLSQWSRCVYGKRGWYHYGLKGGVKFWRELGLGLLIGVALPWLLFIVQGLFGWLVWLTPRANFSRIFGEGSLTGLGVAFAEELFFRGWLLSELEQDYSPRVALGASAAIFALLHFLKPLGEIIRTFPQFPALLILGLVLVWAKRATHQRLGLGIGLHAGLVWGYYQINVGKLISYTGAVSPWVTGVDKNPLAGLMGIVFLTVLAGVIQRLAAQGQRHF